MKQTNKLFCLLLFVVLITIVSGCSSDDKSSRKSKNDQKDTLVAYINSQKKKCEKSGENCNIYNNIRTFKCDLIEKNNIQNLDVFSLVLENDNSLYFVITGSDELYSNNQQCKKIDLEIEIKEIKGNYIISKDDKVYHNYLPQNEEPKFFIESNEIEAELIKDKTTIELLYTKYRNSENFIDYYVLKSDNNIYKIKYNIIDNSSEEEIFFDGTKYGNIKYAYISESIITPNDIQELDEVILSKLITDTSYYYMKEIKTEECSKYKDVKCEYEFVESPIYKKYIDEIKYTGQYYTVLNDNTIIPTSIFELDEIK